MVARLGLYSKSEFPRRKSDSDQLPPPPYRESTGGDPPVLLATATTTEVITTTTHTTTHFFSLPLWRRRGSVPFSSPSHSSSAIGQEENATAALGRMHNSMMFDKDLPPIPTQEQDKLNHWHGNVENQDVLVTSPAIDAKISPKVSASQLGHKPITLQAIPKRPSGPSLSAHSSPLYTNSLAHAPLGPTYISPRAAASSSEINTVVFNGSPATGSGESRSLSSRIRRTKSLKFRQSLSKERLLQFIQPQGMDTQKLDSGIVVGEQGQIVGKGKGKEVATEDPLAESPSRTLSRRPSFWARKKKATFPADIPIVPTVQHPSSREAPSLPSMKPLPPIDLDTPLSQGHHPRRICKSLSEHRSSHAPLSDTSLDISPLVLSPSPSRRVPDAVHPPAKVASSKLVSRRPTTADPSSRSRSHSVFIEPTSLPPPASPSSRSQQPHLSNAPPNERLRGQTNPPLLQRLSVNLFTHSPSPSANAGNTSDQSIGTPTTSKSDSAHPSLTKELVKMLKPNISEESPEVYLKRVLAAVSKAEVASVLASRYMN
jgi:hypothetical protein